MDFLQVALVLLILLLGIMLSILGLQVFLILKDLRKSLDRIDALLGSTQKIAEDVEKPLRVAAEIVQVVEGGVNAVKSIGSKSAKPAKRLFKRR